MKAQIVSFHCVLKDKMGNLISSTFNQNVITQGSDPGQVPKGFVDALSDLKEGERRKISLSASQAYGFYDPELVFDVARGSLSEGRSLRLGDQIYARARDGKTKLFRVTQAQKDLVTLDANHPLAGRDLVYLIETTEVRDATSEEISESNIPTSCRVLH
jgi:FKBP-type peptidyl-prolyl cis-trans isomerase SlyD